jgi:hypothetical protein
MIALLVAASVGSTASAGFGKETKWAVWGRSGGGASWWVNVQEGATSFFATTGGFFLGRGATNPPGHSSPRAPRATPARPIPKQAWFSGVQPRSRAEGGSSQTMEGFIGTGRP